MNQASYGRKLSGELRVRFESPEGAEKARKAVDQNIRPAYVLYTSRPYAQRGWPTFESGSALLAKTHLEFEAQRDEQVQQEHQSALSYLLLCFL